MDLLFENGANKSVVLLIRTKNILLPACMNISNADTVFIKRKFYWVNTKKIV